MVESSKSLQNNVNQYAFVTLLSQWFCIIKKRQELNSDNIQIATIMSLDQSDMIAIDGIICN